MSVQYDVCKAVHFHILILLMKHMWMRAQMYRVRTTGADVQPADKDRWSADIEQLTSNSCQENQCYSCQWAKLWTA